MTVHEEYTETVTESPSFRGERYFLSSMFPLEKPLVLSDGTELDVPSVENVYQAAKFEDQKIADLLLKAPDGFIAKRLANRLTKTGVRVRPEWDDIKVGLMQELVMAKFRADEELKDRLSHLEDEDLVEINPWGDDFWGVRDDTGEGRNELGKILRQTKNRILIEHKETEVAEHQPEDEIPTNTYEAAHSKLGELAVSTVLHSLFEIQAHQNPTVTLFTLNDALPQRDDSINLKHLHRRWTSREIKELVARVVTLEKSEPVS